MSTPLQILILEDTPSDRELVLHELRRAGSDFESRHAESEKEFLACLEPAPDVILADYKMPQFGALRALEMLKERGADIPVIVISGTIGEEEAVECLRLGAVDYLLKDRLRRLGQAVGRALEGKHMRDERKRAADTLRETNDYLESLLNYANAPIIVWDPQFRITRFNHAFETITGRSAAEVIGKSLKILFPPAQIKASMKLIQKTLTGERWEVVEINIQHVDGSIRTVLWNSATLFSADGKIPIATIAQGQDITERKQAEEALVAERSLLRTLIDHLPDAIYVKDAACRKTLANPVDIRNMGASSEAETLGKTDFDSFPHDLAAAFYADDQSVIQSGRPILNREEMITLPDRTIGWQVTSKVPVRDSAGQVIGLVGIGHNITERKRTEEALRESENKLRTIVEGTQALLVSVDAHGYFTYANDATARAIGYASPAELIGKLYLHFIHPEDRQQVQDTFNNQVTTRQPSSMQEFRITDTAGKVKWFSFLASLEIKDGQVVGQSGVALDITERKRAEEQIRLRNIELASINRIGQAFSRLRPPSEIVELLYTHIGQVLDNRNLSIALCDEAHQTLSFPVYTINGERHTPASRPFSNGLTEYVIRSGAPLLIPRNQPAFLAEQGIDLIGTPSKCFLAAPMRVGERVTGVIAVQDYENEDIYDANHVELIDTLATQAAIALENARLYSAVQQELDERKRVEETLRQSAANLKEAQRIGRQGSWDWDTTTDTITWSEEYYRMIGVDPKQHPFGYEEHLKDYTPESAARLVAAVMHGVQTSEGFEIDLELVRADGTQRWITARGEVKRDANDQIVGFCGTAQDITERKRAEAALVEERNLLRTLIDNLPDYIYVKDSKGQFVLGNLAVARQMGFSSPDELVGKSDFDLFPHEIAAHYNALEQEIIRSGQGVYDYEGPSVDASKEEENRWVSTTKVPLRGAQGKVVGSVGLGRDITERKRAEENLRHRLAELEALHTISTALRSAQTRDETLPILLDETLAALETEAGAIWLYHPEHDELRTAVARGWFQELSETPMKSGEGIGGTVFASGQPHLFTEFRSDPLARATTSEQIPDGWGGACVPIRSGAITVGVLFVSVTLPRQIAPGQVKLLESLAEMAGASLHRMSLYEATVRQLDHLQALHRIDQAIAASMDLRMTLSVLLEYVTSQLKVDAASVLLINPHLQTLEYAAGRGFRTEALQRTHLRLGEGYAGRAALERKLVHVPDLRGRKTDFLRSPYFLAEGFVAYYCVPLIAKGQVKGVLEVFHRFPLASGPEWVSFLETLAGQAAIALDNMQLFDNLQRSNVDLVLAYDATIEGWSHALDLRDKETEGHSQRVTEMTMNIARALGMSEDELVHVRRGALLHDIGKMGVPDSILLKPDKLTDEEWVIMRKHPQHAFDMLSPIAYLRLALDIPYCHHEKWDGTGYPRGLNGEQIPLAARIFAVVDVWDALTSNRPYRKAWSKEKALEYIREQSGQHFDPKVVAAFLQLQEV